MMTLLGKQVKTGRKRGNPDREGRNDMAVPGLWRWLLCIGLASVLALPAAVTGKERVLHMSRGGATFPVAPWIEALEDPAGELAWQDVQGAPYDGEFTEINSRSLNFGLTRSVFWLRFRIATDPGGTLSFDRVFDPGVAFPGRVEWALYDGPTGGMIASARDRTDGQELVGMTVTPASRHYYLRIHSDTGLILAPRFYTWHACLEKNRLTAIGFGFFFGIVAAVAVYNLFLFFSFNDPSYLWYVVHLFFSILYFMGINGLTGQYILSGNPDLVGMLNRSFLGGMIVSMALLTRSFLSTRIRTPRIDRIILILLGLALILIVLNFSVSARFVNALLSLMGIGVPFLMVLASYQTLSDGFKPAGLYMAAWACFVIGAVLFALIVSGVLTYSVPGFYAFQMGAAIAAVLLSLALGSRIRMLRTERASLKRKENELKRLAATDPLTGAANRRRFLKKGKAELLRGRQTGRSFSLLMIDVDHFKAVNDTHGHPVGDRVLKMLVTVGSGILRESDLFGRLGGEEFGVILPETDGQMASVIGERLRKKLARAVVNEGTAVIRITVSIGLAVDETADDTLETIMKRADAALYRAKKTGRNRLVRA